MMTKKSPQLRFEGFTDDWEERKLRDLLNKNSEKNKNLSVINVESVSNKTGFTKQTDQFEDYSVASADLSNYYVIREKQFAYNPSRINVGSIAYKDLGDEISVVSPLYVSFSTKKVLNDGFLWNWFKTASFDAQRQRLSEGGVRDTLSFNQLSEMNTMFPTYPEQEKIGSFFKQLDNTIALHQRKLDLLKEQKKGYLQKMFPKNGAKVPELRFAGFADDWEERKLGDISKVIDPHPSHRAPAATEEGIPFIGIGDVNEVGNINYKTARIVDAKIFDEHHNRYDLSIPSIGIGRVASLGKVIRLRDDIGKYVVSPTMSVIQFTNNNDLDFLYSNMNTPIFQKQFKSFSNGSTRQSVGIQDLRILMVSLPVDIEEQQKIGSFFKQLDNTIALHQRKLDLLKEQKKGFLQKMFV